MIYLKFIMPLFFLLLSVTYLLFTLQLPKAKLGDPNAPLYFPLLIGGFLLILSIIYFIQVVRNGENMAPEFRLLTQKKLLFRITGVLLLALCYAFSFQTFGYSISTFFFLLLLLFLTGGKKRLLSHVLIALIFTISSWFIFSELLKVSLP